MANEKARERRLMDNYKLSLQDADRIFSYQNSLCYICGCPEPVSGRRLSIDHDHATGLIRGALCSRCNPILGKLERAYRRYGLHKVSSLTFAGFVFAISRYIANPPAVRALKRQHFGYIGQVGTKAHRNRVKKERKNATPRTPN